MKIGQLAALTDCPVETIRYYESLGLIPASLRGENNYRYFQDIHKDRLIFIRKCRNLGMSLDEIQRLIQLMDNPQPNCLSINDLIDEHIQHVEERIHSLQALQKQLQELRERCQSPLAVTQCGILQELGSNESPPENSSASHVYKVHKRPE